MVDLVEHFDLFWACHRCLNPWLFKCRANLFVHTTASMDSADTAQLANMITHWQDILITTVRVCQLSLHLIRLSSCIREIHPRSFHWKLPPLNHPRSLTGSENLRLVATTTKSRLLRLPKIHQNRLVLHQMINLIDVTSLSCFSHSQHFAAEFLSRIWWLVPASKPPLHLCFCGH